MQIRSWKFIIFLKVDRGEKFIDERNNTKMILCSLFSSVVRYCLWNKTMKLCLCHEMLKRLILFCRQLKHEFSPNIGNLPLFSTFRSLQISPKNVLYLCVKTYRLTAYINCISIQMHSRICKRLSLLVHPLVSWSLFCENREKYIFLTK